MEFSGIQRVFWGILGFIIWTIGFWYFFYRPQLYLFSKIKDNNIFNLIRFLIYIGGVTAWIFLAISLMGPRQPLGVAKNKIDVTDIFFVVDVSRSMLAEDFKPNRLEAAKSKIREFIDLKPADRIGLIMFSERVFTLLPLSTDLDLIKNIVSEIKTGFLGSGTNIGDAIGLAVARAAHSLAKSKVIILLTDGVSNVGSITPLEAAQKAKKQKVKIYTIGMGGDKDAQIPLGKSVFGKIRYQNIPGGSIDMKTLNKISKITNAKSYIAKDSSSLENILREIRRLEKTKIDKNERVIYKELYHKYLLIGVILLILVDLSRKFILKEIG